jgi:hypothetical protein
MRVVRWVVLGLVTVALGATIGFLVALLRPRRYADVSSARQPITSV